MDHQSHRCINTHTCMIQSTLNSPTTHTSLSCAKRSMPKFYFLDSISRNSENESPITLLLLMNIQGSHKWHKHSSGQSMYPLASKSNPWHRHKHSSDAYGVRCTVCRRRPFVFRRWHVDALNVERWTNRTNVVIRIMRDDESKGGCNSSEDIRYKI